MFNDLFVQIRTNGRKLRSKIASFISKIEDFQLKKTLKWGQNVLKIQFFVKIMSDGGLVACST